MHIRNFILLAISAYCTLSISAAPVYSSPDDSSLSRRDVVPEIVPRVLNAHQVSQKAVQVQKGQTQRANAKSKKAAANKKVLSGVQKQPKTPGFSSMSPTQKQAADKQRDKKDRQAKGKALADAQKKAKEERKDKWAKQKVNPADKKAAKAAKKASGAPKGPATTAPKNQKLNKDEKKQVKDALSSAGTRMKNTQNIPGRKDQFSVGGNTWTGKEVRKGVMNSHLHGAIPIGRGDNKNPKEFRNDAYAHDHPEAALRGQKPIPGATSQLKEYPVMKGSPSGWTGTGPVGAGRVVTSQQGGKDVFHGVIGHDPKRGTGDDHFLATHKKVARDEFENDFE